MADLQATATGQNHELSLYSSPNDVQGAAPRKPKDTETINDFIPADYHKDPSRPECKFVTAGLLRAGLLQIKIYQERVTCDLQKVLDKGSHEPLKLDLQDQGIIEIQTADPKEIIKLNNIIITNTVAYDSNKSFTLREFEGEFSGNENLVKEVAGQVYQNLRLKPFSGAFFFAFVHSSTRSAGRTFTATSLPELMQSSTTFVDQIIRFVSAYISFNVKMPLTNQEKAFIQKGKTKNQMKSQEERVCIFLLSRFILVLEMMIKHNKVYDTNYEHAQPMMPIDLEKEPFANALNRLLGVSPWKYLF